MEGDNLRVVMVIYGVKGIRIIFNNTYEVSFSLGLFYSYFIFFRIVCRFSWFLVYFFDFVVCFGFIIRDC